jgi:hypothetical protein
MRGNHASLREQLGNYRESGPDSRSASNQLYFEGSSSR